MNLVENLIYIIDKTSKKKLFFSTRFDYAFICCEEKMLDRSYFFEVHEDKVYGWLKPIDFKEILNAFDFVALAIVETDDSITGKPIEIVWNISES